MSLKKFLKEYYGLIPVTGGLTLAGLAGTTAYSIGLIQNISKEIQYISSTGDIIGGIVSLYDFASSVAGKYVLPGFVAGQLITYKFKKAVVSAFKRIRRWKNGTKN